MIHDDAYSSPIKSNQQPLELKKPRPNNPRPPGPTPPSPSPTTFLESNNEDSNNHENYNGNPIDPGHNNSHDNSNNIDDNSGDGNYHAHNSIGSPCCSLETSTPVTLHVIVYNTTRNNPHLLHSLSTSSTSPTSRSSSPLPSPISFFTILKSKLRRLSFCIPSSTTTASSDHQH